MANSPSAARLVVTRTNQESSSDLGNVSLVLGTSRPLDVPIIWKTSPVEFNPRPHHKGKLKRGGHSGTLLSSIAPGTGVRFRIRQLQEPLTSSRMPHRIVSQPG